MKNVVEEADHRKWLDLWKVEIGDDWFFKVFFEPMIECASSFIDPLTAQGGLLLDLGCAEGNKTRLLDRYGVTVVGIDVDPEAVGLGASIHPSTLFVRGDMQYLPFDDGAFDVVFSNSVLQLVDWRRVIRECRRVLKPNGRAVFIEHLRGNPLARVYRAARYFTRFVHPKYEIPVAHIEWGQRLEFEKVFSKAEFNAFHLITPMLLATPALRNLLGGKPMSVSCGWLYDSLHRTDCWLLRKFPALANLGWMLVVRAIK